MCTSRSIGGGSAARDGYDGVGADTGGSIGAGARGRVHIDDSLRGRTCRN